MEMDSAVAGLQISDAHRLICHPETQARARFAIDVRLGWSNTVMSQLNLCYRITGDVESILLPAPSTPVRADNLWQHSCFEAFFKEPLGDSYDEYNFAPSGAWAMYRFDAYRDGMSIVEDLATPEIAILDHGPQIFEMAVTIRPNISGPMAVNLTTVIEEKDGGKSYWALKHPDGPADFHDPACFILQVDAPRPA